MKEIGATPDGLDAALVSQEYGRRHDTALKAARSAHIRSVPSIGFGDRIISGVPKAERLRAEILSHQS